MMLLLLYGRRTLLQRHMVVQLVTLTKQQPWTKAAGIRRYTRESKTRNDNVHFISPWSLELSLSKPQGLISWHPQEHLPNSRCNRPIDNSIMTKIAQAEFIWLLQTSMSKRNETCTMTEKSFAHTRIPSGVRSAQESHCVRPQIPGQACLFATLCMPSTVPYAHKCSLHVIQHADAK